MKHTLKCVLSLLLALSILCSLIVLPVSAAEDTDAAEFVVLSTTDMHGRCWDTNILNDTAMNNSMLNVATAVQQMRATYGENVVLIDNGDTYQGTPVSSLQITQYTQGLTTDPNPMAISMKYIGYDMSGLGNHEFNYAWSTMSANYAYLMTEEEGMSTLPTVCANLYYDGTDGVHAAGENVMTPYITTTVKDSKGKDVKIAILAFDTPDCTRWDIPDNYPGMRFSHPDNPNLSIVWEAKKWLNVIEEKESPDFVIVSFHSGLGSYTAAEDLVYGSNTEDQVLSLIQDTTGIDMVIAGHDHSESYSNNTYKNANGEEVLVVNGGGNSLTTSVFSIAADGSISLKNSVNNKLSNYAADATLKGMLQKYADAASDYVNSTAGTAIGTWDKETNFYLKQSDTIDLIGRAQITQGSVHMAEKYDTEEKVAALYEATGLDHLTVDVSSTSVVVNGSYTVSAGNLSMKDIYRMYRYDNSLYLVPVSGKEIKDILEFNAATHLSVSTASGTPIFGTKGDNFTNPIFYGLDFQYDMSREEYDRVVNLKFADGREVEAEKMYIIAINNYHLGNASGPFADYTTDDAIWSQTDDMGGGFVQDLISEYLAAQTAENGGVSPEPSNWSLVYNAEVVIGEAEGTYIGNLVDPNTLATGDQVLIYYPASNTFISNVASGSRLAPSEDVSTGESDGVGQAGTNDATAVFTVQKHDDGSFSFVDADGKYMTSGASGNAMTMEDALTDCAKWTFVATDNGWYVHNEGANYMGNYNQYLEYYYGFTTYGLGSGGALYTFNFYKLTEQEEAVTLKAYLDEDGKNMFKYGQLDVEISVEEFLKTFDYGDVVDVSFYGKTYENMPVCTNYTDVSAFELLVRAAPGYDIVTLAIQYGQIGIDSGIIVATENGYEIAEGVEFPIEVTFTLKEKGGYAETLEILRMNRTNNREDYPELTDEQFANFRMVTTTGMGEGRLYRSSNPVNPKIGRNTYADAAAAAAGVKTFVNLADTQAEAEAYEGYAESYYSQQNVIFLGLPAAFTTEEFKSGLAEGFRFMTTHEGPYLVHCTEGKDRAGLTAAILESFMGATWQEIAEDYLTTYHNYYTVIDGVQTDLSEAQENYLRNEILKYLGIIFEVEDVTAEGVDLQAEAEAYLAYIGLTEDEIATLKANLTGETESLTYVETNVASTDREGTDIPTYITLPADYSEDESYPLVVMLHGHGGNHNEWGGYDAISDGLAENGFVVVTMDFPGCGASTESFVLNNMTNMKNDVVDVVNYMLSTYAVDEDNIVGFGYSMGGRLILELIAEERIDFATIELVAPAAGSMTDAWGGKEAWEYMKNEALTNGYFQITTVYGQVQQLGYQFFVDLEKYADDLIELAAEKYQGNSLVIWATDDAAVSPETAAAVAEALGSAIINTYADGHSYSFYGTDPYTVSTVNNACVNYAVEEIYFENDGYVKTIEEDGSLTLTTTADDLVGLEVGDTFFAFLDSYLMEVTYALPETKLEDGTYAMINDNGKLTLTLIGGDLATDYAIATKTETEGGTQWYYSDDISIPVAFSYVVLPSFTDVTTDAWYYDYVISAANLDLVNGYEDGSFRPDSGLTRAEAVTLLYRFSGSPEVEGAPSFTDLDDVWYLDAIAWAEETGVVTGVTATTFAPNDSVTREQFITMLWRLLGEAEPTEGLEGFEDDKTVSEYALKAFGWGVENGIINGTTFPGKDGFYLAPQNGITRAEAAKLLVVLWLSQFD